MPSAPTQSRVITGAVRGKRGSGAVELNGAMARLGAVGDRVIVMAFAQIEANEVDDHRPRVVALDGKNRIVERIDYPPVGRASEAAVHDGPDCWAGTE